MALKKLAREHPYFAQDEGRPLVMAHRGGGGLWPENTLYAFERAAEMGVDVIETEIHSTADNHLVFIHDETVNRTTNGTGKVNSLTLKELKEFDLSLVGTDPLYASNAAKSPKEKEMLAELAKGKEKVIVAEDGGTTVGMSADYAIVDSCADCHNNHPKTTKKDWKKGDFMGAIVVRLK
jgi:glycerophosphoryl diester phosphodiesterase